MPARPQLLAGLQARRAETLSDISALEARLRVHYETLRSLDHLIKLEDPEAELPPIRNSKIPDRPKTASTLVRGDVSTLCLEAMRSAAGDVLSSRQVVDYIIRKRQLVFAAKREDQDFASSVTMALNRHAKRGIIERIGLGPKGEVLWRVPLPEG